MARRCVCEENFIAQPLGCVRAGPGVGVKNVNKRTCFCFEPAGGVANYASVGEARARASRGFVLIRIFLPSRMIQAYVFSPRCSPQQNS